MLKCTRSLNTCIAVAVTGCCHSSSRRRSCSSADAAVSGEAWGFGVGHGCRQVAVVARVLGSQEIESGRRSRRIVDHRGGARGSGAVLLAVVSAVVVVLLAADAVSFVSLFNVRV